MGDTAAQEHNEFQEWYHKIVFSYNKITLPNGSRFDKTGWYGDEGFDSKQFKQDMFELYNSKYAK
jgi:hypothetical protein